MPRFCAVGDNLIDMPSQRFVYLIEISVNRACARGGAEEKEKRPPTFAGNVGGIKLHSNAVCFLLFPAFFPRTKLYLGEKMYLPAWISLSLSLFSSLSSGERELHSAGETLTLTRESMRMIVNVASAASAHSRWQFAAKSL